MTFSDSGFTKLYEGTGVVGPYSFPYYIFQESDLKVYKILKSTNVKTLQTSGVDYTFSGTPVDGVYPNGGNITFGSTVSSLYQIYMERDTDPDQPTDYQENEAFPAASHEQGLDKIALIAEELKGIIGLFVALPANTLITGAEFEEPSDGKGIYWDAASSTFKNTTENLNTVTSSAAASATAAAASAATAASEASDAADSATASANSASDAADSAALASDIAAGVLTTKGDLVGHNGSALVRVAVGSNDLPIVGDSAAAAGISYKQLPEAGIADDAITLAKLAAGTDGELITWDASGNPTTVSVGTSGQVLTSNGAGAAPTFQDIISSFGALLESSEGVSGAASVDFESSIDDTYRLYTIVGLNVKPSVDGAGPQAKVSEDTGSTYKAGTDYEYGGAVFAGATSYFNSTGAAQMSLGVTGTSGPNGFDTTDSANSGIIVIQFAAPAVTGSYKNFNSLVSYSHGGITINRAAGIYKGTTNPIDAVRLQMSSGNISGDFYLYGVNRA